MSKVNELFGKKLTVVNFGIESFYRDLVRQDRPAVHVDWKPIAGGDKKIAGYLRKLKAYKCWLFPAITTSTTPMPIYTTATTLNLPVL